MSSYTNHLIMFRFGVAFVLAAVLAPSAAHAQPAAQAEALFQQGRELIAAGKLDAGAPIDEAALKAAGLVRGKLDGVRLLANGEITRAVTITVSAAIAMTGLKLRAVSA